MIFIITVTKTIYFCVRRHHGNWTSSIDSLIIFSWCGLMLHAEILVASGTATTQATYEPPTHSNGAAGRQQGWRLSFTSYPIFNDIEMYLKALANNFPNLVNLTSIGKTQVGNRDIQMLTIRNSAKDQKRAIFIDALLIPAEYHTALIALYMADQLVLNSSYYMYILDTVTFYIIPAFNSDGYDAGYNRTKLYNHDTRKGTRMACQYPNPFSSQYNNQYMEFMKNQRALNLGANCNPANYPWCQGVSLATNFPFQWNSYNGTPRRTWTVNYQEPLPAPPAPAPLPELVDWILDFDDERSIHYRGKSPCSERECQSLVTFLQDKKAVIDTYVSLHGFSQFWALPYAYSKDARPENYAELGVLAAAVTGAMNEGSTGEFYRYGHFSELYDVNDDEIFNGEEHPGNPMDFAKSIGIRFTYWACFGPLFYTRPLSTTDLLPLSQRAWRGFQVLATLKDQYGRPVFPSRASPSIFTDHYVAGLQVGVAMALLLLKRSLCFC